MALKQKTVLDSAAAALTRHLQALEDRQKKSESGELRRSDLDSMVKAAEVLRSIEFDRVSILMKVLGRRMETMPKEELKVFISLVITGEPETGGEGQLSSV